jgi:hypothetical protein
LSVLLPGPAESGNERGAPDIIDLTASLSAAEEKIVTMLNAGGTSIEELSGPDATAGRCKTAPRACQKLRHLLGGAPMTAGGDE